MNRDIHACQMQLDARGLAVNSFMADCMAAKGYEVLYPIPRNANKPGVRPVRTSH